MTPENQGPQPLLSALDALSFSSVLAAAVAWALTALASRAMGAAEICGSAAALGAAGTFCVYNVDRLRDLERDRHTTPLRTAFVERHRTALSAAAALAGLLGAGLVVSLGPRVAVLCAAVAAIGLLHRRLKHVPFFKSLYICTAWIAVTVGLPALLVGGAQHVAWIAFALAGPVLGNLIVSNLRDGENTPAFLGSARSLRIARIATAVGGVLALMGPSAVRPVAWVAACSYLSLLSFRPGERYGLHVVDGSLLLGGFAGLLAMNY